MRDRLIELLKEADEKTFEESLRRKEKADLYECTADYLLANGVIVPPCNVGTTVYAVENGEPPIPLTVDCIGMYLDGAEGGDWERLENFGRHIFLTEKEADARLRKGIKEKGGLNE